MRGRATGSDPTQIGQFVGGFGKCAVSNSALPHASLDMTCGSIVIVDPMDAMARLQLARALALSGDAVKAKSAYNDLFTLWKRADPDIPALKEARAEYARLP
jgi:hypothetical protein